MFMFDILRSCIIIPLIYLYTFVMGTLALVLSFFDRDGRLQHWCATTWCRQIAVTAGAKVKVRGLENLPQNTAAVFIANHASYMDIPAIWGYVPVQFRIMAKRPLFYLPFLGWFLWRAGHIPVDRGNARAAVANMKRVVDKLHAGCSLVVYAEGHRSPDGVLQDFKTGGFKLALKAGVPIIPITIIGSNRILKKDSLVFHAGEIEVIIDPQLATTNYNNRNLSELVNQTHAVIAHRLAEKTFAPTENIARLEMKEFTK